MGRQEPSKGLAPPSVRRDQRAKEARFVVTKMIPAIIATNSRARAGNASAELIVNPPPLSGTNAAQSKSNATPRPKGKGRRRRSSADDETLEPIVEQRNLTNGVKVESSPRVSVCITDTLSAAQSFYVEDPAQRIAILNMASALRPGGGVLQGATSQEEHLCARTTLISSLQDAWYRLPAVGGIWSPDVLVFRIKDTYIKRGKKRFFVDVVSASMSRSPEVHESGSRYAKDTDREACVAAIRGIVRILKMKGATRIVLGAWGCGAYGNPIPEVSRAFKKALMGEEGKGLGEIVFAITDETVATAFAEAWGDGIQMVEEEQPAEDNTQDEKANAERLAMMEELETKITQVEQQIQQTKFPAMKERLQDILAGLKTQMDTMQNSRSNGDGNVADVSSNADDDDDQGPLPVDEKDE